MKADFTFAIKIGMSYDDDSDKVSVNGVRIEAYDEDGDVIDIGEHEELTELANGLMNVLKEEEA